MACTVEEAALTAELEGVLDEEREENTKKGGCPHAALLLCEFSTPAKSRVLLAKYYN